MAESWACCEHVIPDEEQWILHERVFVTREWLEPKAPGRLPVEHVGPADIETTFTLTDVVALLRALPSPGEDYLAAVEEATRTRRPVATSPWES